jgi:dynein heavy chain 2
MTFVQDPKSDVKIDDLKNPESPPIVRTINIQRDINLIKPWLDQGYSFILVGPEGSGKNLMIRNLIKTMKST